MAEQFRATVKQSYVMKTQRVLVLQDDYAGDIEIGDRLRLTLPSGQALSAVVVSVAWGSAYHAESSPLTLVVEGIESRDLNDARVETAAS